MSQGQRPVVSTIHKQCPFVTPSPSSTIVLPLRSGAYRNRRSLRPSLNTTTHRLGLCDYATALIDIPDRIPPSPAIGMANSTAADAGPPHDPAGVVDDAGSEAGDLRCCCGKEECVFLRHNCSVLSSVERDVHAAARMGQVSHPAHSLVSLSPCFSNAPAPLPLLPAFFVPAPLKHPHTRGNEPRRDIHMFGHVMQHTS